MLGGPGSHFDMLNGQPFIPNLRSNSGIIHYGQIQPRIYLKGHTHLLSSLKVYLQFIILIYRGKSVNQSQILRVKHTQYLQSVQAGRQLPISLSCHMVWGFIETKVLEHAGVCGSADRSSVSQLGITFAWELRIYSRGSNCSRKGPEATSEGDGSQMFERSSATLRKGIYSSHLPLLGLCCTCFENEYSSAVTDGPEQAVYSDFSTGQRFQNIFLPSCSA